MKTPMKRNKTSEQLKLDNPTQDTQGRPRKQAGPDTKGRPRKQVEQYTKGRPRKQVGPAIAGETILLL